MDNFAIFEIQGKQYQASPGQELTVQHVDTEVGKKIPLEKVLLISEDGKVSLGNPYLTGVKLSLSVVAQQKGPKLTISKYKAKSRYQKETGFRAKITRVRFNEFSH